MHPSRWACLQLCAVARPQISRGFWCVMTSTASAGSRCQDPPPRKEEVATAMGAFMRLWVRQRLGFRNCFFRKPGLEQEGRENVGVVQPVFMNTCETPPGNSCEWVEQVKGGQARGSYVTSGPPRSRLYIRIRSARECLRAVPVQE